MLGAGDDPATGTLLGADDEPATGGLVCATEMLGADDDPATGTLLGADDEPATGEMLGSTEMLGADDEPATGTLLGADDEAATGTVLGADDDPATGTLLGCIVTLGNADDLTTGVMLGPIDGENVSDCKLRPFSTVILRERSLSSIRALSTLATGSPFFVTMRDCLVAAASVLAENRRAIEVKEYFMPYPILKRYENSCHARRTKHSRISRL